jgi:uncharacterized protein YodC (DUF2158 family)
MPDEIKIGDIVHLKSGGPDMTVDDIAPGGVVGSGPMSAWCTWFDSKGEENKGTFPLTSLTKK